jgi:DNA repair protein RecN (Recombination protein N)
MLARLSIKNYALIDEIDIRFARGLNMITGETGAGKSIILGALSLILGQRSESKYFYNQHKKCVIEGFFDVANYDLQSFFEENDLDYEKQTILRREIYSEGKTRAFINDTPVKLSLLKTLSERLIAIHSQHALIEINKESFQLLTIDSVADNKDLRKQFSQQYYSYQQVKAAFSALQQETSRQKAETDYHQFLFQELDDAQLKEGEQVQLEEEMNRLQHAEEIKMSLQKALFLLDNREESALQLLRQTQVELQPYQNLLSSVKDLTERLQSCFIELKDINDEIQHLDDTTGVDSERLLLIQDRLSLIYKLQQKHQADSVEALIAIREDLDERISSVSLNEERLIRLQKEKEEQHKELLALANQLSASRRESLALIEKSVEESLASVGMPHSRFVIDLKELPEDQIRSSGLDAVEFLFSANVGQEVQTLSKVASGGELSRLMLAIKSLIAQTSALPTIIFDEIDTGISGEVAIRVGELMNRMTENLQVIAISHLPQIAAQGSSHYKVYKEKSDTQTMTNIRLLNPEERVAEIAEMLGGKEPAESAILHARDLLQAGHPSA